MGSDTCSGAPDREFGFAGQTGSQCHPDAGLNDRAIVNDISVPAYCWTWNKELLP
jgi:hypothetical protein